LKKLQGQKKFNLDSIKVPNAEPFNLKSGRVNLVLGSFKDGMFHVFGANKYGSGMVKPLINSNALWVSDEKTSRIEAGDEIRILLF
jgi:molybdopterin molybdotransferase